MTFGEDQGIKPVISEADLLALFTLTINDGSCPITSLEFMLNRGKALDPGTPTYEALGVATHTGLAININTQYDPIAGEEALDFIHVFNVKASTDNGKWDVVPFEITIHSCFNAIPSAAAFPGRRLANGAENPNYIGPTFTRGPFELILGGSPTNSYSLTPMFITDDSYCPILYY